MAKKPSYPFAVGTKVADPLVRYSEYSTGPYKPCRFCGVGFTHLGLQRHITACPNRRGRKA